MAASYPSDFLLERFFVKHEFESQYLLCCSDAETLPVKELVDMASTESRELWDNLDLGYTRTNGHPKLREEIAKLYKNIGNDDILVTSPQEALYAGLHALVHYLKKSTDEIIHAVYTYPAYQSLSENLTTAGATITPWNIRCEEGKPFYFDLGDLEKALQDNTKILVINFPHNPSGVTMSAENYDKIREICKTKNIFLFSDEMYKYSNNNGTDELPSPCESYDHAMSLGGLSKPFGLPGLRIGWLVTRDAKLLENIRKFKDYLSMCSAGPSEILSIIALQNKEKLLGRTNRLCEKNLNILDKFMKDHEDWFEWHRPTACTTGLLKFKQKALDVTPEGSASAFCSKLIKDKDVLLAPTNVYHYEDKFARLGFGRKNLPEALDKLSEFLKELQ